MKLNVIEPAPDKSLIEHIEDLLKEAKSGELQGLIYVCRYKGDKVAHGWAGVGTHRMRVIGELEQMKWHLMALDKTE